MCTTFNNPIPDQKNKMTDPLIQKTRDVFQAKFGAAPQMVIQAPGRFPALGWKSP